jgi:hypothetical protein
VGVTNLALGSLGRDDLIVAPERDKFASGSLHNRNKTRLYTLPAAYEALQTFTKNSAYTHIGGTGEGSVTSPNTGLRHPQVLRVRRAQAEHARTPGHVGDSFFCHV